MGLAVIAFGSNMGNRRESICAAVEKLFACGSVTAISDIYETPPAGYENQPKFLNGALALETEIPPHTLLCRMLEIESELGRVRTVKDGPRRIDLDLIFYGGESFDTAELALPHPRWPERDFVITPLLDLFNQGVFDGGAFAPVKEILKNKVKTFEAYTGT